MAIDFDALEAKPEVKVQIVTVGGHDDYEVKEGTTVKELREMAGLNSNVKMIDENNKVLSDRDVITGDAQIFASPAKELG